MHHPKKILIDGPAWIGDMVMAGSLFRLLKSQHPTAQIDVLAPPWTKPLLDRMPEISHAISLPFGHGELQLRRRYQFAKSLRQQQYDWSILMRNSFKSGLIPYWAKVKRRTGWLGEMRYPLLTDWRKLDKLAYPKMVERFVALGLDADAAKPTNYPLPRLVTNADSVAQALAAVGLAKPDKPVLALCPAAEYGPAKRWPEAHFAEVAKAKYRQGWIIWLMGSAKDKLITSRIAELAGVDCVNLAGKTDLNQAIDLLSLASGVVSNDSGLMHIAAALNRNLVVLYGSSSATFTPPLSMNAQMLSLNLSCSPCFKRECPLQHLNCLNNLKPSQVLLAMEQWLS